MESSIRMQVKIGETDEPRPPSNPDVAMGKKWRAPSERIRTASEIPLEVDLTDEDAVPIYKRISDKVLHLRRFGMTYTDIAERLGINPWMAKKAVRWGNIQQE